MSRILSRNSWYHMSTASLTHFSNVTPPSMASRNHLTCFSMLSAAFFSLPFFFVSGSTNFFLFFSMSATFLGASSKRSLKRARAHSMQCSIMTGYRCSVHIGGPSPSYTPGPSVYDAVLPGRYAAALAAVPVVLLSSSALPYMTHRPSM